jgi:hypothetical protein
MKTQSIEWSRLENRKTGKPTYAVTKLNRSLSVAAGLFLAAVPALAIVVGSAWLVSAPELVILLQAALWSGGFLFFGLALDAPKAHVMPLLASGFALPTLALMSANVALELAIVAASIVALWVAIGIYQKRA